MRAALLAPVLLTTTALLAAGCLGPAAAPAPPERAAREPPRAEPAPLAAPPQEEAPAGHFYMHPFIGSLTLAAGAQGLGYVSPTGTMDRHVWRFLVEPGASALMVELHWDDPTQDLDLQFGTPECDSNAGSGTCVFADGGSIGAGDSPVAVTFVDAATLNQTGDWFLAVWGKNAVKVEFEVTATVFYGMAPPEGFTAFAPHRAAG